MNNESEIHPQRTIVRNKEEDEYILEGSPRQYDSSYQKDVLEYLHLMRRILHLLSVRSAPKVKDRLLTLPLRIRNRGRVEAFVSREIVYVDIAFLDLLWLFSFDQGVADVKRDPFHMIEFILSYACALHSHKGFEPPDPYNTAPLNDAQFRKLWEDARQVQQIAFENTLAFTLAHEVGHILLAHEEKSKEAFPDPSARHLTNQEWVLWRRQSELAADRFGALLSLEALFQPAQVIPWFDLVEVRRSFYGSSVEYPTPGQRTDAVQSVNLERFQIDGVDLTGLPNIDPLPPDRDMTKMNRVRNLENVRRVRTFRRNFLFELDNQAKQLLNHGVDAETIAEFFVHQAVGYQRILHGAENPEAIEKALCRISTGETVSNEQIPELYALFEQAFHTPEPISILTASLETESPDVDKLRQLLEWSKEGLHLFADAINLEYLLANTHLRWMPTIFPTMLMQLSESQRSRQRFGTYKLGESTRPARPSFNELIEVLQRWDGRYTKDNQVSLL